MMASHRLPLPTICLVGLALGAAAPLRADDAGRVEFFEKKIRPVLVEQCQRCHSAEAARANKLKGGLRLDSRADLLQGGDSGPAVVPGKSADSLLLKALRYDGDLKMPPRGKLPDAVIADFAKWIDTGAIDPRSATTPARTVGPNVEEGRTFWAYQLPQRPPLPAVTSAVGLSHEIDRFISARLEGQGLSLAPEADRATLARRLFFDLVGLPPTPEQVDAFVNDRRPDAYERLVDQLLASPHYGERWGRRWLDVVRFGESLTLRGFILKEAWRYRDYVIEAFNRDRPYDRFVKEQIAGDLLPAADAAERRRGLIATAFLVLGNTNLEEQDKKQLRMDFVDEQLDVIGKGLLAQTITCARCHDHKFDPIPTRDYYALAGILRNAKTMEHANVSHWIEVPLPVEPDQEAALRQHETRVAALQARLAALKKSHSRPASGALAVADVPGIVVDDTQAKKVGTWQVSQFSGTYIGAGYVHDQNAEKGTKTLTFQPDAVPPGRYEVLLAYSPGGNRADAVPVTVFSADGEKTVTIDMKKPPSIDGRFVSLGTYRFEKNGQAHVLLSNEGTKGHVTADAVVFLMPDRSLKGPAKSNNNNGELRTLEAELKRLQETGPKRPMTMSVVEEKTIEDCRVHIRGSVHTLGDLVPRGVLQVARHGPAPTMPRDQSGRRELAEWIASRNNPLTARVLVNRVWQGLFGAGIVRTVDNFGTTGERPSHPELLDWLAVSFMDDGWSIKKLVRRIVLSRTYRQASLAGTPAPAADPENRLLSRANRRRLEAECLRDTLLAVSGRLDLTRGGPTYPTSLAADYGYQANDPRRSVYVPVFRNALPDVFTVFDFADPSLVVGQRSSSTVAPQALFFLNHPFAVEQARAAATRLLDEKLPDDDARITRAYRRALGREPTVGERTVARRYLTRQSGTPIDAWAGLFHALFASADFRYLN